MSAKYKSPSFLLPNEINTNTNPLNTDGNPATGTGVNSLYSMNFDGTGDVTINPALNVGKTFTLSFWVNLSSVAGSLLGSLSDYIIYLSSTKLTFKEGGNYIQLFDNLGGQSQTLDTFLTTNNWHNLVITRNEDIIEVYIDGYKRASATQSSFSADTSISYISKQGGSTNQILGKIDEVSAFNYVLSDGGVNIDTLATGDIATLYNSGFPSNLMATDLNPVAYYPLGEQAQNTGYVGSGDPGNPTTLSNVWQFPNGVLQDYVMDFDGSDNINSEANISSVSSFTASIWINRDDSATQYIYGQWVDGTSASQSWIIQTVGGIVYFNIRDASLNVKSAISTTSLTTGVWYNIIAVWTGSNIKLYINNSLENTTACSSINNPSTAVKLAIGSSSNNVSPFNGKISNAVIWNSDQESNRDNIYNNGSPQTTYTVTPQNWWKLNSTSVYTPSAPNYTTALDFSGSGNRVNFNSITLSGNKTVSYWLKPLGAGLIVAGSPYTYYTYYNGSNIIMRDSSGISTWTNLSIDNAKWHHFCITGDGTNATLYVNGESKGSQPDRSPTVDAIGAYNNGVDGFFNGNVSNLAIYNVILTPSQVSTLFNFGTPETNISFDPQAWWKLNDQTAITDSSGNGNTGTNNGATDISSGVAVIPSWKIPSALTVPTVNYTTALDFNSSNDEYVDIGNISYLNQAANNFTISQWVFSSSTKPETYNGMSIKLGSGFLYLANAGAVLKWEYEFRGGSRQNVNTGVSVPEDRWIHIALTVEGTVSKFYQDGNLKHTGVVGTTFSNSGDNSRIGQEYNSSYAWDGKISNTALFNSALSGPNITTLYNNGQPEVTPSFSPLHWWKLNNTSTGLNDVGSAASNNGTLSQTSAPGAEEVATNVYIGNIPVNGVSTTLPSTALQQSDLQFDSPYSNYSLSFDGSTSFIDCGSASYLNGLSKFSISCWFKLDTSANNNTIISDWLFNQAGGKFALQTTDSSGTDFALLIFIRNSSSDAGGNHAKTSRILTEGNWYNVIFSFNSGSCQFYINGLPVTTTITGTIPSNLINVNGNLNIGKFGGNLTRYWNGNIDETSIFNYALSSAQVLEIYNNGKPDDLTTFSGTAPTNWWRLGENAYFVNNAITVPNSITGAPNGTGSGSITTMISADAPGTYANGIGTNLAILDRVGDAPLSTSNSQSYNMIPSDISPYVPQYVGKQIANNFSMTFDGIDDYIDAGTGLGNSLGNSYSGDLSISIWFKATSIGTADGLFSINNGNGVFGPIQIYFYNNRLYFRVQPTQSGFNYISIPFTDTTSWHHLTVVYKSGSQSNSKMYLDGAYTSTNSGGSFPTTLDFDGIKTLIGYYYSDSFLFNGSIDEVAIFDTALNAGQIYNDIYQPTATGTNQTADLVNNPNLPNPVAWYRMGD